MLFNSLEFLAFFPTVFAVYWALRDHLRAQNALLVGASYVFYGWWDWRFLALIAFSSVLDYSIGRALSGTTKLRARKRLLWLSIGANLSLLGLFKYFNFFAQSFADLLTTIGIDASWTTLHIVLPVGISFYTFQTLSYTIDVYRGRIEATQDPVAFLAFVSFFPQLVAGPIERAANLLPQFEAKRTFDEDAAVAGLRQILWGLFKKVAVADTCGAVVDEIFASPDSFSGLSLAVGAFFFAMQIYGDFSGYSDIAIGSARLLGVNLMKNFSFPYFSRDMAEFWRRWHISLSTWFRDYVYIPLGGSRLGKGRSLRNIAVVFLVSGLWHGANWTFVIWGALNAVYFVPLFLGGANRANLDTVAEGRLLPSLREATAMATTFSLTLIAWVFFRADSVGAAIGYLTHMVTHPQIDPLRVSTAGVALSGLMLLMEWLQREHEHGLDIERYHPVVRTALYLTFMGISISFAGVPRDFIYFQF